MDLQAARRIIASWNEEDEAPAELPASVLPKLAMDDLPEGITIHVGTHQKGVLHLDWNGMLGRDTKGIYGEADHTWTRKYWYSPLGLEQYLDLVRRAVETRHRVRGDVELMDYDDDGAYVALRFRIDTDEKNLGKAYDAIRKVATEVEEAAEQAPMRSGSILPKWRRGCPGGDRRRSMDLLTGSKVPNRLMIKAGPWKNSAASYSAAFLGLP
ncbi:MAG: hypothetical protein WBD87_05825 [Candidatus Acidiferrales bacterium]